ncbi:hypothetical protein ACO0QE_000930 [Hanseniaspora vineae]
MKYTQAILRDDKSPLNVDPKNLNVSNGLFKFKDINLNANDFVNGSISSMEIQISSGLVIKADGTDLILSAPASTTSQSSSSSSSPDSHSGLPFSENDIADSFMITKSVMDLANSVIVSIDEVSKQEIMDESNAESFSDSDGSTDSPAEEPPKSVIESMRNKIIDMALSNLQIYLTNTRLLILEKNLIVHIDSIQVQTIEKQRILTIKGVSLVENPSTNDQNKTENETEEDDIMMGSSIYMSAMSDIKTRSSTVHEQKTPVLKHVTMTFTGITDINHKLPRDIHVSKFVLYHQNTKTTVFPFVVLINRNLSRTLYSIDQLKIKLKTAENSPVVFLFKNLLFEVFSKVISNYYNNLSIKTIQISHPHFSALVSSRDSRKAVSVILKNQNKIDIKLKNTEIILKPYRISTGMILRIPNIALSYFKGVLKGTARSCGITLLEDIETPQQARSNVGEIKGFDFKYENKKLSLSISDVSGFFCCDSFYSFIQTCVDIKQPISFPDDMKYATEPTQKLDLSQLIQTEFFNTKTVSFQKPKTISSSEKAQGLFEEKYVLLKNYLDNDSGMVLGREASNKTFSPFGLSLELQLTVGNVNLQLYDGYEWSFTRSSITKAIQRPAQNEQLLFGSIMIESPRSADGSASMMESTCQSINEALHHDFESSGMVNLRKTDLYKASLKVEGLKMNFVNYTVDFPSAAESDRSGDVLNKMILKLRKIEIFDNVPTSNWNKFLTSLKTQNFEHHYNETENCMFELELENVRPVDYLYATELRMAVRTMPLKMHIHEDMMDFMARFFTFKDSRFELIDEYPDIVFLQKFEIFTSVINIDFKPAKSQSKNLKSKIFDELKTLIVLDNSEIVLKHVVLYGIDGFGVLGKHLQSVWLLDILSSQRLGILNGVAPVKTVVTLSSGVKALVEVPYREHAQQGLLRSIQKGLGVFGKTTSAELLRLGVNLSTGTQNVLESTESAWREKMSAQNTSSGLSTSRSSSAGEEYLDNEIQKSTPDLFAVRAETKQKSFATRVEPQKPASLYSNQPLTTHEGLTKAYDSMGRNISLAYELAKSTGKEVSHAETNKEAAMYIARATPGVLLRPLIGATEALSKTLQGLNNELDNDQTQRLQAEDKYKR